MDYRQILEHLVDQEVTSTFFSGEGVVEPGIFRLEKQRWRWYYTLDPIKFYVGTTTWIKRVMPTNYFLTKWYKENDLAYLEEKYHYSGHFGTFEHIMMALLLREGSIDLDNIREAVNVYWELNDIVPASQLDELATRDQWERRIVNDLLCIVAFVQEKNFTAHAIEWIGSYDGDKVPMKWAGAIDLIGELDFNGTRKTAIIDLKTGSLYDDQVYQLIANKLTWDQHNDIEIDLLMNLKPKKFTNKSKYKLKNRKVDEGTFADFKDYASIAARNIQADPDPIMEYSGELSRESDLTKMGAEITAKEYVNQKHN